MTIRLAIASDHAGFGLKEKLIHFLEQRDDVAVVDLGPRSDARCDYPDYAAACARAIEAGEADRGVLVCGSGIGVSIVANRFGGIRAALVQNALAAKLSREHNNANVLCLGSRLIGDLVAMDAVDAFLTTRFAGGRHADRIAKINAVER
ncbi:MAG: ribose 5-phosphate isomerase B [Myxococcota bacterium]|nr:ribose 5-phosphate isomerase B [Myxococcota bacterium]